MNDVRTRDEILNSIKKERDNHARQHYGNTICLDREKTVNDWSILLIEYVIKVGKGKNMGDFIQGMTKVASIAVAAIENKERTGIWIDDKMV